MERIEDCLSFAVAKANQAVAGLSRRRLAPLGVTPVQFAVLQVLGEADGRSGAELGERLRLDAATITGVIDRLVAGGLVERRADPADRRINRIHLTADGCARLPELRRAMDDMNADLDGRFPAGEAERLRGVLARLAETANAAP